ncbi:MAG: maleylpyruvate isomerase family mycothiol-dependent enzyme [Acidimicrobiales bacterium]
MGRVLLTAAAQEPVLVALAEEWEAVVTLGAALGPDEWALPSECPGWTVRDIVSHMVGTERSLLGETPPPSPPPLPHVRNDMGASNEAWVAARRSMPGPEVLAEFRDVTAQRLDQLRSWPAERFDEVGPSPVGQVPYREFMHVRVMDCWVHEQDIRVATGRPGHNDGPIAAIAIDRIASAMPFVAARKASAPEGASIRFELVAPASRVFDVVVRGGRGSMESINSAPDVVIRMDVEVFWRLGCGRVGGYAALGAGLVHLQGDADLGRRVVGNMAFMI